MQPSAWCGVGLAVVAALARPAAACNEWTGRVEIVAATADGTFLQLAEYTGGFGFKARIEARAADGTTVAACDYEELDERWRCQGDPRLRARGDERPARVIERWRATLGALAPTLLPQGVPIGVTAALCSRFRVTLAEEAVGCGDADVVTLPGASMWFARTHLAEDFCGATSSFDGVAASLSTDTLRARLAQRIAVFERRGTPRAIARAAEARDALRWLESVRAAP